jgi:hypothetical protein
VSRPTPTSSAPSVRSQDSVDTSIKAYICDVAVTERSFDYGRGAVSNAKSRDDNVSIPADFPKLQFNEVRVSDDSNASCELSALNDGDAEVSC